MRVSKGGRVWIRNPRSVVVNLELLSLICVNSVRHTRFFCELAYMMSVQRYDSEDEALLKVFALAEMTYEVQLILSLK